ncbi:inositol monophosphatase family protein [Thermodesulfatator autotrophicus]|uniref:Inositol-1-monophosphatase n=1 Tax=Thermodesulfatator autotrophicus TaxID=1795632 RepID=A0A177ECN5_9BACT|nr:inositol monophosphatase family protein [Thermodesulfatator autotrophicus]OAG28759.1 inositol monophosphatase [Thermodesulfatator autotrophicus]
MDFLALAKASALAAGRLQREFFDKEVEIRRKGEIDLVTEVDLKSEKLIVDILKASGIPVLGEEEAKAEPVGRYWLVDPLDGTTNYAHRFPWFAPSIALMEDKQPVLGVIYHVMLDELFWAERGKGAYLNGRRLSVSRIDDLNNAVLATGFPYGIHEDPVKVVKAFHDFLVKAQGVRRAGAAALDLAYVACGRLDGFWEPHLKPWDTAAGILLVEEAGGKVSNYLGEPYDPFQNHIVASNGLIHKEMTKIASKYLP